MLSSEFPFILYFRDSDTRWWHQVYIRYTKYDILSAECNSLWVCKCIFKKANDVFNCWLIVFHSVIWRSKVLVVSWLLTFMNLNNFSMHRPLHLNNYSMIHIFPAIRDIPLGLKYSQKHLFRQHNFICPKILVVSGGDFVMWQHHLFNPHTKKAVWASDLTCS